MSLFRLHYVLTENQLTTACTNYLLCKASLIDIINFVNEIELEMSGNQVDA